jgi:hypothetical protein
MQTHEVSAHTVVDALTIIHREWSTLTPHDRDTISAAFNTRTSDFERVLDDVARILTNRHPFVAPPQAQIEDLVEEAVDQYNDMNVREYVEDLVPDSDWKWRQAIDEHREMLQNDIDTAFDEEDRANMQELLTAFDALATQE